MLLYIFHNITQLFKVKKVETLEELEILISKVKKAQKIFSTYSQEKVDAIFKAAAAAADKARIPLARQAVEETGMGVLEDKIIKNHFASEYIYNKHKNAKTDTKLIQQKCKVKTKSIFKSITTRQTKNKMLYLRRPLKK